MCVRGGIMRHVFDTIARILCLYIILPAVFVDYNSKRCCAHCGNPLFYVSVRNSPSTLHPQAVTTGAIRYASACVTQASASAQKERGELANYTSYSNQTEWYGPVTSQPSLQIIPVSSGRFDFRCSKD